MGTRWFVHVEDLAEHQKVDIIGGIDGLRYTVDLVRDGDSTTEIRIVFHIVH